MTRHSKNCTAGTVYSYHERQRDTKASGYGSKNMRLGKDSVKEFDCCCLTLQPCKDPVITAEGYLFDKAAILEYILQKKKEISRKLKEYHKQENKEKSELEELGKAEAEAKKQAFQINSSAPVDKKLPGAMAREKAASSSMVGSLPSGSASSSNQQHEESISNMTNNRKNELPSFWIPTMTPNSAPTKLKKPDEKVRCPMSGKPIKLKDLITVNFTAINDRDSKTAIISKQARYVCAVTNDVLGNSVPAAVLKPSGSVVTMECVEKLIKKDMLDPINGAKLTESDIIPMQRGASGFTGAGNELSAKKEGAVLMC